MKIESFEYAFHEGTTGCVRKCECGIVYYNPSDAWDFEENELEKLEKDRNALSLDYAVGTIELEGKEYVCSCNCWHKRAEQVMGFLDSHANAIAEYFKLEKERIQSEVDNIPVIKD